MSASWSPQGDMALVAQGTEAIVYEDPQGNQTPIAQALPRRQEDQASETPLRGLVLQRRSWLVPQEAFSQPPVAAGRVLRAGQSWTLQRVESHPLAGTYLLEATTWQLALAQRRTVEVLAPQWSQDAWGGAQAAWNATAGGLPAQIQAHQARLEHDPTLGRLDRHYRALLEPGTVLEPGWRLRDDLGRTFDVLQTSLLDAHGGFLLATCALRD